MIKLFKINRQLLPMKGHFFLWNAGTAPIFPFMTVYAKQLGFSSFTVGIIYTIMPILILITKPIVGGIADKYKNQKKIFLLVQVLSAIGFFSIIFVPALPTNHKINFSCDDSGGALFTCNSTASWETQLRKEEIIETLCKLECPTIGSEWNSSHAVNSTILDVRVAVNMLNRTGACLYFPTIQILGREGALPENCTNVRIRTECGVICEATEFNEITAAPQVTDHNVYRQYQFWIVLAIYIIALVGNSIVYNISDTICFQLLGNKPYNYGVQRMYGALGWGVFTVSGGLLVDYMTKDGSQKDYTLAFGIGFGLLLLSVLVSYKIQYTQQPQQPKLFKDITSLLLQLRVFIFILMCVFSGACSAVKWNFLFWLLEDLSVKAGNEKWIKTIEGLSLGVQSFAGQLPFFFFSSSIIKKIGHVHTMTIIVFITGVSFVLFSVIENAWTSIPIALLSGATFALFCSTTTSYANIVAPSGAETTTQALFSAASQGIGTSLGSFIGGILIRDVGTSQTSRIFGIASFVVCVAHAAVQLLIQKFKPVKHEPDATN